MSRHLLKRAVKYSILGSGIGCSTFYLWKNDWELTSIGVVRFGRAACVALRIAVDYKLSLHNQDNTSPAYQDLLSKIHLRSALRLREMICKNGGVFIKVGQHVGTLDYLLPEQYVSTMKVLHNQAPQSDLADLQKVVEEDLGKKIEELFINFESKPIGAASLAQVHKATLRDGQVVAVKIQHPKVRARSYVDIKTMELLVRGLAIVFPGFQYLWLAEETKKNLPLELDFLKEGTNCETVAKQYKHFSFLKVPKILWNLSSERVLTMEYFEGGKVDDREYMKSHGISVNEVSRKLGKLYSEMIFVQGYVHCDPHPGNVLVKKTETGVDIILLDHGLYQSLTDDFRLHYCKMWMAMINADVEGIKEHATALNAGDLYGLFACMLSARSWSSITSGMGNTKITREETDEIKSYAAALLIQISDLLNRVPRQLLLILKTNDVLRGIETSLETRANATSFINMSRCCVRALTADKLQKCHSNLETFKVKLGCQWQLCKIGLYEMFLWLQSSFLGRYIFTIRNAQLLGR
ncbi:aarF domain-containing protein kinase 1-like [Ylistrum balloti]|uniref:aarF domain-containing protein kinase 1-like n=1 Tax=Ylistrum balloti TaxID=509963 RepID=UPI002905E546|nr:aarF domain-containing protein kinase 1-like [Ylistrum balloti]